MPFIVDSLLLSTELTPSWLLFNEWSTWARNYVVLQACRVTCITLRTPWCPTILGTTLACPEERVWTRSTHEAVREATFASTARENATALPIIKGATHRALGLKVLALLVVTHVLGFRVLGSHLLFF